MVNQNALRRVSESQEQRAAEAAEFKKISFPRAWIPKDARVQNVRFYYPFNWHVMLSTHGFGKGNKPLRRPYLCDRDHYGERKCKLCLLDRPEGGKNYPSTEKWFLAFMLDRHGRSERSEKTGKRFKLSGTVFLPLKKGGQDGVVWDELQKFQEEKQFRSRVIQLRKGKGQAGLLLPTIVEKQIVRKIYESTLGEIPEDEKARVNQIIGKDFDKYVAQALINCSNVDWGYWQVDEPEPEEDEEEDSDDDDNESEDEDDEDDKDEQLDRGKLKRRSKRDEEESENEEDDDQDEDEEEEEDDSPPPRRRR